MQEKLYQIDKIYSRIAFAFRLKNERSAVAEFLDVPVTKLDNWRVRDSIGDWDVIFEKCKSVNLHWLILGEGKMEASPDLNAAKLEAIRRIVND
jgi:hypothetical protein